MYLHYVIPNTTPLRRSNPGVVLVITDKIHYMGDTGYNMISCPILEITNWTGNHEYPV